jgi:hypothetical protein
MASSIKELFADLLALTEVRKVDYKRDQYLLANENSKSEFIKDIVCIANAPGDDGYILLGVESDKGKPREVVGISGHYDSSNLEAIVNGVIDPPIQFEYYPLNYKGAECALFHIPKSKAKPHWPKRDYGKLSKHIIYTRRSSGNREASIQEIREMCVETMQLSDIAHRKIRVSPHIIDELRDMSLDDRKVAMYKILKSITPKLHLMNYYPLTAAYITGPIGALLINTTKKAVNNYCIVMYPWTAKGEDIIWTHRRIENLIEGSQSTQLRSQIRTRLKESALVHISYKDIYTKALEKGYYAPFTRLFEFANAWNETWGKVVKWEANIPIITEHGAKRTKYGVMKRFETTYQKEARYEFFISNVTSKSELQDRLEKLLAWMNGDIIQSSK